ncbi:MAG: RtcB family protein [Candidatus Aenigmatarchaeota archaeon]
MIWEIPTTFKQGMKVPARIYATKKLIDQMDLQVYDQITNVATLPGIQKYAFCMPDGHSGYGFPIGGVAAFDPNENGVISPGGIGFDINCGMRLVLTNLTFKDVQPHLKTLVNKLFERVPAGVGSTGFVKLTKDQFRKVVEEGAEWCIENGYGWEEDLERTELNGKADWADVSKISSKAIERGFNQIGTLGSGNHYLEVQIVKPENIFDEKLAKKWGLFPNQVVVMFHCGSRGFGHQIGTDYLQTFLPIMERKYGIKILDRELACAPFNSPEGQDYFKAMACGVNMSFANRQVILHRIREVFADVFKQDAEKLGLHMVFDIAHNRASLEEHEVDGKKKKLVVHRKGATGSYPAGREEIPKLYRDDGSPVIIGGSMETGSYLLVGGPNAAETFMSTAHGSGRTMSRTKATKMFRGQQLFNEMLKHGIYVKSVSWAGLAEEAGAAYKNIDDVIEATHLAGISKKVVRFIPVGNIKG